MITKLTAENSGLYYAPAFELINQALKAAGSTTQIHSVEEYFNVLTDEIIPLLVNRREDPVTHEVTGGIPGGYLLLMPADEEIFSIDANTRVISIPNKVKKNGVGVYGDHNAEMLVLDIDRYFDNQDLLNTNIAINWNFTANGERGPRFAETQAVPAFAPNCDLNPEKVTFGFIIDKNMTPAKGTLTFSVTFYTADSNIITYSFNTLTASVAINDTLTLEDPSIISRQLNDEHYMENYLGRFVNSVYQDNTISPVGNPIWKSGSLVDGSYTGLEKVAYFSSQEDIENSYENGVLLKAYATVNPNTANITYKWTVNPVDGTVDMGRSFNTLNLAADYLDVELPSSDVGEIYYAKNVLGQIDSTPLTFDEAKALIESQESSQPYLSVKVKKLATAPEDDNEIACQENQDNVVLTSSGNIVIVKSKELLNSFASTNEAQGSGKWIGFDIDTGLNSIIGVKWNGYDLTSADVLESNSVGLPGGHIVFWAKAEDLQAVARNIILAADGYRDTPFVVQYSGIDADLDTSIDNTVEIINETNDVTLVVRGTSFRALHAGNYQVCAQARISAGENYEDVLDGAELKVGTYYYRKDENDNVDTLNPLMNEAALQAQQEGAKLCVLASASRNSDVVESSVLTIPPAVQPEVTLSMGSEYIFSDDVIKDEDYEGEDYIYIDDSQLPVVLATVKIPSEDIRDEKGAFVAELVKSDAAELTKEAIEESILREEYHFAALPDDKQFRFEPDAIEEGEYLVRVINRRNGTYSVSDPAKTEKIRTSFVAPGQTDITVSGAVWDEGEEVVRPETGFKNVLVNGVRPDGVLQDLKISRLHPRYTFNVINNSVIDGEKYKLDDIVTSYYIEEVEYNEDTGEITSRTPLNEGERPYEDYGEADLREIVNREGALTFEITNDFGAYRIKVVTKYHGTTHITYTDIFTVSNY